MYHNCCIKSSYHCEASFPCTIILSEEILLHREEKGGFMRELKTEEFGKLILRELPLPEGFDPDYTTYTPSGRVSCKYRLPGDEKDMARIMTLNDDGTDINIIYEGKLALSPKANGYRYMPFNDNRRAYIGDYILECTPDCDHTKTAEFVPIHYPEEITQAPGLWMIWSENVVAPDNEHIAWSTLGTCGAVYVAKLRREEKCYELDEIRCVSTVDLYPEDPDHEGCVLQNPLRGGEVKQFVRGGRGLSFVGMGRGPANSMLQALDSEEVTVLSRSPGYDETMMLSPDEKLGVCMTTRFSPDTNCAVIGLIPRRGNELTKANLSMNAYLYAIAGPRFFRSGTNIGPALVDLERSIHDMDYQGIDLHDPEERFIYHSPISWHPGSKKAMWNERLQAVLGNKGRVMILEIPEYEPGETPGIVPVPDKIPYAKDGVLTSPIPEPDFVKIAGKYSGFTKTVRERRNGLIVCTTEYDHFSDDGKSFLDGVECAESPGITSPGDTVYTADLRMHGEHAGKMQLKLIFKRPEFTSPVSIDPTSEGFAEYDGFRINVKDMDFR